MTSVYDALRRKAAEQQGGDPPEPAGPAPVGVSTETGFGLESEFGPQPEVSSASQPSARSTTQATGVPTMPSTVPAIEPDTLRPVAPAPPANAEVRKTPTRPRFERIEMPYRGKTVLDQEISAQSREQYRRLAASLHHAQATNGTKVIMVTSAAVGEGKTLTSSNLALTLSESYQKRVLLVDADFRRPSVHAVFGVPSHNGLADGLMSDNQRVQVCQFSERLSVLPGGQPSSDPIAALTSERMRQLVDEARENFDWVILDTPPVTLLTDASLVASITDGAVIVVKAGSTSCDLVERTVQALGRERIFGVVLNRANENAQTSEYYDYYRYYAAAN
jgi:capsular exopolysaccharide family